MSFRIVASANGVLSVSYGVAALIAPAVLSSLYGVDLTDREGMMVRLLGASYLSIGVIAWAARGVSEAVAQAAIAAGAAAGWGLSAPVFVVGLLAGHANAFGWTIPALQIAFAIAWSLVLLGSRRRGARATA